MSEWLVLGLFALGFYLYECCTWTPATVFACYRKPLRRKFGAAAGSDLPGNESGGFAFSDPLTLSGNIIHSAHWPVAVSPDGICADSAEADRFWPFDAIASIHAHDKSVRIGDEVVCRAASETLAVDLAIRLEQFRTLPKAERARAIRSSLRESFDAGEAGATWERFNKSSRRLRSLCSLPLLWLSVITPAAIIVAGPLTAWPYLLGGLFASGLIVSIAFVRLHRRELPNGSDRWIHAVSMTLFPIASIRAVDRLSKDRLAAFNPLAIAGAFCAEAAADPLLRRFGFDLERPLPREVDPAIAGCREWYLAQKRAAFKELLKALKRDPFAAPERIDEALAFYCPRCHGQFEDGAGECADCADVTLVRLAS